MSGNHSAHQHNEVKTLMHLHKELLLQDSYEDYCAKKGYSLKVYFINSGQSAEQNFEVIRKLTVFWNHSAALDFWRWTPLPETEI